MIRASDVCQAVTRAAFHGGAVSSVLLMNPIKSPESSRPRAPVAMRQFSATHVAVFRNGSTSRRSGNETES